MTKQVMQDLTSMWGFPSSFQYSYSAPQCLHYSHTM